MFHFLDLFCETQTQTDGRSYTLTGKVIQNSPLRWHPPHCMAVSSNPLPPLPLPWYPSTFVFLEWWTCVSLSRLLCYYVHYSDFYVPCTSLVHPPPPPNPCVAGCSCPEINCSLCFFYQTFLCFQVMLHEINERIKLIFLFSIIHDAWVTSVNELHGNKTLVHQPGNKSFSSIYTIYHLLS